MIVEMTTTQLQARSVGKYEAIYAGEVAENPSPYLKAFWHTVFGPLNMAIELAAFDSYAHRAEAGSVWPRHRPSNANALVESEESRILIPAPFSPPLEPRRLGSFYEMRIYTFSAGELPNVIAAWGEVIDRRTALSPLAFAGHAAVGPLHQLVHVWAYEKLEERERVRKAALAAGFWPPRTSPIRQQNLLLQPSDFSPLR